MKKLYCKIKLWLWQHSKKRKLLAGGICRNIESWQFWRWVELARCGGTNRRLGERRVNTDGTISTFCKFVGDKPLKGNIVIFDEFATSKDNKYYGKKRKRGKR